MDRCGRTRKPARGPCIQNPAHTRLGIFIVGGLGLIGASTTANAQILQQYLPDTAAPAFGLAGALLAPDVAATARATPETQPGVTVATRAHPEYDSAGLHVGDFYIRPLLSESLGYNSNLFANRANKSAIEVVTTPSVSFATNWVNRSLTGEITATNTAYPTESKQNYTNWGANLGGSYDLGRDRLTINYRHADLHIARGSIDSGDFDTPIPFQVDTINVSYLIPFARFSFEPALDFTNQRFSNGRFNGLPLLETVNNHNTGQATLTTRYELAPLRSLVLVTRGIAQNFYSAQPGQPTRNSKTAQILGGIDFSVSAVIRVRALIGYEQRSFTSSTFPTRSGPIINADVIWSPTQLTTVTGSANRSIEDGLSVGTTGITYTSVKLAVDHELLRNVVIGGRSEIQIGEFASQQGTQTIYSVGAAADWRINRRLKLRATYDYTYRDSSPALGQSFSQNLMLVSFVIGL